MTDRKRYYEQATSWASDTRATESRASRIAWTVAGIAGGIAMLEAVALALLTPLKTVQPITLLVDRQTGYVQSLDPLNPRRIGADAALTNSMLAQYVAAREGFDRATIASAYRHVALWSSGLARAQYLAAMPASNPESPLQRLPAGTIVNVRVKSVSPLGRGTAMVRFDTERQDRGGGAAASQPWIAIVRYRWSNAAMSFENRLANPLGFQVTSYRRDPEAPAVSPQASSQRTSTETPVATRRPAPDDDRRVSTLFQPSAYAPRRQHGDSPSDYRAMLAARGAASDQIPSGSPLVSQRAAYASAQ